METANSSEKSVNYYQLTWCNSPEDFIRTAVRTLEYSAQKYIHAKTHSLSELPPPMPQINSQAIQLHGLPELPLLACLNVRLLMFLCIYKK
jgi:hypothetical protein